MGTALLVITSLCLYFFPAIYGKDKRNAGAIFALNLFLGWTLVGWVVALVWAVSKDNKPVRVVQNKVSVADEITRYKNLQEKGLITEEQFLAKRDQLMK